MEQEASGRQHKNAVAVEDFLHGRRRRRKRSTVKHRPALNVAQNTKHWRFQREIKQALQPLKKIPGRENFEKKKTEKRNDG